MILSCFPRHTHNWKEIVENKPHLQNMMFPFCLCSALSNRLFLAPLRESSSSLRIFSTPSAILHSLCIPLPPLKGVNFTTSSARDSSRCLRVQRNAPNRLHIAFIQLASSYHPTRCADHFVATQFDNKQKSSECDCARVCDSPFPCE